MAEAANKSARVQRQCTYEEQCEPFAAWSVEGQWREKLGTDLCRSLGLEWVEWNCCW